MQREQWNSQTGFLLAAVGSAIGLGNIWRFSYIAYSNGGGAFLIPYITALLTAGISMLILEFGVGHGKMGSAPLAFSKIRKNWEWLGWWSVTFVMFGIELYYTVIIAWCLSFFVFSFSMAWGSDPDTFFFNEYLCLSSGPGEIGGVRWPILMSAAGVWLMNWIIVFMGLKKGIERANKIFMPFLFLLMATLVFWSLTLEGAMDGIRAYLTPDFSVLTSPKVWVDAYSQIFFDLSLGFGIMIAYSSYLPEKADLSRNALITGILNCSFSLMSGFAVFSVLGFMARSECKPITEVVTHSIGLAFVAYPKAVSLIPGGRIFGAIFFLSLVLAGLSSSISIIEAFSSSMVDKFQIPKKKLVTVLCALGLLGSVIFTCRGGLFWLDITDHFLSHYGLVAVGILECLLLGWMFDIKKLREHINKVSTIRLGVWWDNLIRYFIPAILTVIFISEVHREIKTPYEGHSWTALVCIGFGWIVVTLATALIITFQPWRHGEKN